MSEDTTRLGSSTTGDTQPQSVSANEAPPPPSGAPVAFESPSPSANNTPLEVIHEVPANGGATTATSAGAGNAAPPPPSGTPVTHSVIPESQANTTSGAPEAVVNPLSSAPEGQPVIYEDRTQKNGIDKCPYCGSSDIQLNVKTGLLHCNYCQREFSEVSDGIDGDISRLSGMHMGRGASDIADDAVDVVTLKCTACGAEVVVDTNEAPQARCHWCRNVLSLNQQIPNGAVPDAVMPFRITKEAARAAIENFVGKRRFFANPRFKAEFTTENIMGVYLPYMVVDVNAHATFKGQGEHQTRKYTVGSGNNKQTRYDADLYAVGRNFDLYIDDLTVEASSERLNQQTMVNSNNVINAILPFPLKETVRFNANYLRGFTSEKRSVNRDVVEGLVNAQVRDVARFRAWQHATFYDRGIRWDLEEVSIKGELWKTVYLPVWLYSYLEVKSNGKKFLHYVAVNACTGETMGSVPIHMPKLLVVSTIIEIIGIVLGVSLAALLFLAG